MKTIAASLDTPPILRSRGGHVPHVLASKRSDNAMKDQVHIRTPKPPIWRARWLARPARRSRCVLDALRQVRRAGEQLPKRDWLIATDIARGSRIGNGEAGDAGRAFYDPVRACPRDVLDSSILVGIIKARRRRGTPDLTDERNVCCRRADLVEGARVRDQCAMRSSRGWRI